MMRRFRSLGPLGALAALSLILSVAPGALSQPKPPKAPAAAKAPKAPAAKKNAKGAPSATPSAVPSAIPSAAPTVAPSAPPTPPPSASAQIEAPPAPTVRKQAPPPPPPTPQQLAALGELEKEADAYEKAARDYRSAITGIVQHHYKDRRQRVLAALDAEIATEEKGLRDAREEAIRRLEQFVNKYSGKNAHPENTPDAMFRLAALYEERARASDSNEDLALGLKPAVLLYKRVIREFPQYRELAGIFYYLGHAYNDSNRFAEAQQVWRALVCRNKYVYPVPPDPKDPEKDSVAKLPQDHDRDYWTGWDARHPTPLGGNPLGAKGSGAPKKTPPGTSAKKAAAAGKGKGKEKEKEKDSGVPDDEVVFKNPYTEDCVPIPQKTAPGQEPRYIAEVWWLIGDYHFNEIDHSAGPFNFNRAEAGYKQSLKYKKPPVHGVAMYKLAWTYFKQQRYETSVRAFVDLLRYSDEQEKATGDPGTDFRSEAYTYIAGSLTYIDFAGPGPEDPYIPRNDVLDLGLDPRAAEQQMRIAIERVQDEKLIPQKEKWTVEIYRALVQEYKELNQHRNMVEVSELILKKWPMYRDAPLIQNQIADIYDLLASQSREGTPERALNSAKALEARTKLSRYIGNTDWVEANKNDPEAIQQAERLVRGGLRRAAADHTNAGSALMQQALGIGDKESRDPVLERALSEYKLAVQGWSGYLTEDENAPDAYETRFWLADAYHNIVVILVAMERTPTQNEVDNARKSAVTVRDSNEDDKYLQPSAYFVVDVAHQVLMDQYKLHERSKGAQGIEKRDQVKTTGEGDQLKVVADPLPKEVLAAIAARDEYVVRVPVERDVVTRDQGTKADVKNSNLYAYDAAELYFLYGQFAEAKKRYEAIYKEQCKTTPFGFKAWDRLTTMATLEHDVDGSRKLAQEHEKTPCMMSKEDEVRAKDKSKRIIAGGYYIDAYRAFKKAEEMKDGPERAKQWREAGALYRVALEKAPARDEAPEAAINGAIAYKQVGDYDQAIEMYNLFIKEYGNEERLQKLQKGDPAKKEPAEPEKYKTRVGFLKRAYDALSDAYVLFFNYRTAAETYDTIAKNARFPEDHRRKAARNAVLIYANVGDREKMSSARTTFLGLKPSAESKADIDYLVASADLKTWDEHAPDEGPNRGERLKAIASMDNFFATNKNNSAASAYVVLAAYHAAKMRKAGRDTKAAEWCKNTITAFEKYKSSSGGKVLGTLQADMAAECAYNAIDEKIRAEFDYDTGHHRYTGVIDKVTKAYNDDLKKAEKYFDELKAVIDRFQSRPWSVAAKARQGSLYDSCRTGLYNARPPGLRIYTDKEEKFLKLAETSGRDDLQEKADAFRQKRREDWRATRERLFNDGDRPMIKFYIEAVIWSRAWKVRNPPVDNAIQRLAFFTDILTDVKMREYAQGILDPETKQPFEYKDGIFLRTRPGMTPNLQPNGLPGPLPVVP